MKALEVLKELESSKVCKFFCKSRVDEAIKELEEIRSKQNPAEERYCKSIESFAKGSK